MASGPHASNEVDTLVAIEDANTIHAGPDMVSDLQSGPYPHTLANPASFSNNIHTPRIASATNQNGWATRESWMKYRALIKQLYLQENKSLAEVMRIMESQHGFRATVKMYKSHIKQWGLDKKNKESEMRAIVRKKKQRAQDGKDSIVLLRGRIRNFGEVVRYWDRKGVSIDDILARYTTSPTPEAVEFSTPVPSPITTPQVLAIPECMFRCIRNYFKGSFESGTWVRTEPTLECYSIKDGHGNSYAMEEFCGQCSLACALLSRNLYHEAGKTLIVATARIQNILSAEQPRSLLTLFELIGYLRNQKRDEIGLIVLRQFSALGQVLLGSGHPLSQMCEWAVSVYASNLDHVVMSRSVEIMADQLETSVGPMHQSALVTRVRHIKMMTREWNTRIQMLHKLLGECDRTLQPYDTRTLLTRRYIANQFLLEGHYAEAKTFVQQNIAYVQKSPSNIAPIYNPGDDLYMLAQCEYALGEVELGIAILHQAIDFCISRRGYQGGLVRQCLLVLEEWYYGQARWDCVALVRKWRQEILESMETD